MSEETPEAIETTGTFGNYLIHGIDEIILPDAVSWWPIAPGWKILGVLILLVVIVAISKMATRWWQNRYRREALRQLDCLPKESQLATLPYYMKVTALQAYPRQDVACLSGNRWLAFLDAHYDGPSFSTGVGIKLLAISYLPNGQWKFTDEESTELIRMSRIWISKHRETTGV
jgi:hypothetical protein